MNWFDPPLNLDQVPSPGLLVDADRVVENIQTMIALVGGRSHVGRLRTHVKTHKMPALIQLQRQAGIENFKVATIAEAAMTASEGAADVLLAYQPVGPNLKRLFDLVQQYPKTSFAVIVDDVHAVELLTHQFAGQSELLRTFIDTNCGMHRTGVAFGDEFRRVRAAIEDSASLNYAGLHVYDGHIHDPELATRQQRAAEIIEQVRNYDSENPSPLIIAGGSPTFGIWAQQTDWQCSPGTTVFWDVGYASGYPEMEFLIAAALVTRVISKPANNRICLDLGYKAVASERPLEQRVVIPSIPDAQLVGHSEEHLVVETSLAGQLKLGDCLLAYPRHICPTVALHASATVIRGGKVTKESWPVTARDR